MSDYPMLIGGKLVDGDNKLKVVNPATEAVFATIERASQKQAGEAIAAAKAAFPAWSKTPIEKRQAAVSKIADIVRDNAAELAGLLTAEQGKPLPEALGEMAWTEGYLRHYATLSLETKVVQDDATARVEVHRKPLGVVVGIVAWNFPVLLAAWKLGPALVAGNTIVLKPAPTTPVATLRFAALIKDAVPPGVVNVIADENELGAFLTSHPDVAKVSFTGSTETGKKIMKSGADTLKRLTLELGGNDVAIVLDDVNVKEVAPKIFDAAMLNCGQVCMAAKRIYVQDAIYDEMASAMAAIAKDVVVDDGAKQGARIGPLQNRMQFEKVKGLIDSAKKEGATVVGGESGGRTGFFIKPAIITNVKEGNRIVDEEQFGPVIPLIRFKSDSEIVSRANASPYGLGGSVWSSNFDRARKIAEDIDAGTVWINQHITIGPHIPMAGSKQSGIGVEQSQEGLAEFTQVRVLNMAKA
ncbi:MAG: aldehyde dehydrogenase [Alphaproteobacteria bacterium RIFCSPHIGHO2_12_FULL_63_12]|nr:MAG: aldehyde dehydrogenase [Alphaproteobacteria bacterium RIFCSPHIGHO2_12_FULL_63_12]